MITDRQWRELLRTRATDPDAIARAYATRGRRRLLDERGTLFLVAADHPARGALGPPSRPLAMGHRRRLLDGLVTALAHPEVDGVVAAPDVVEELLLLGALEHKIVLGSMNRGGLDGAAWTLDDRFTAYDAASIAACGLDGGKLLLRLEDTDPGVPRTLEACARAVSELAARGLTALVEPLPYRRGPDGALVLADDTASLVRALSVAAGLGTTSARTWLKTPACDDPDAVYAATTLPCLVLGGAPGDDLDAHVTSWLPTLRQPNVRGVVAGRTVLQPDDGDVARAVAAVAAALRAAAAPGTP